MVSRVIPVDKLDFSRHMLGRVLRAKLVGDCGGHSAGQKLGFKAGRERFLVGS